jgi:hypothetical protein
MFLIIIGVMLYLIGVLAINTALDYRPEGGRLNTGDFDDLEHVASGDTLSIITWNIGYAGLGSRSDFFYDGGKLARPHKDDYMLYQENILQQIGDLDTVNLFLLQEVDISSKRSFGNNQHQLIYNTLASHAGYFVKNYDVAYVPLPVFSPMGRVESGISFFGNKRLAESFWRAYGGTQSWPLGLFMPDRCFSVSVLDIVPSGRLYVFNTHNSAFDDGSLRNSQLDQLYSEMKAAYEAGFYVIAGGDWNLNPSGYENDGFLSGDISFSITVTREVDGPGPGWKVIRDPAFPTNRDVSSPYEHGLTPTTLIDFFVCSPNINILYVKTLYDGFANSDHHPVYLRFSLD